MPFRLYLFTNLEVCLQTLEEAKGVIFLIDETFCENVPKDIVKENYFYYFTKDKRKENDCIHRYQSARDIYQELLALYRPVAPEGTLFCQEMEEGVEKIAFIYPLMEESLNKKIMKALNQIEVSQACILNLETFDSLKVENKEYTILDLIEMYRKDGYMSKDIVSKALSMFGAIAYLGPPKESLDLIDIKLEEWHHLMKILESLGYQKLILLLGMRVKCIYPLMALCQRNYLLEGRENKWIDTFKENLERSIYRDLMEKTLVIKDKEVLSLKEGSVLLNAPVI